MGNETKLYLNLFVENPQGSLDDINPQKFYHLLKARMTREIQQQEMGYQPITRLPECIMKYSAGIRVRNMDREVLHLNCKQQRAQYNH